ncbi:MAG: oligosaccharide flippase family protein [Acetobacter sp.]|nr:oligosaccharide flippase family protein [Acetobacter sp.]
MDQKKTSPLSRIMGNTSIIVSGRLFNAVCSFIFIPWTTQTIGLTAFGQLVLIIAYTTLIASLTHMQTWQPLLHYGSTLFHKQDERKFYQILAFCIRLECLGSVIGLFIGLVGIAFSGVLFGWPPQLRPIAIYCALTILFMNTGWSSGLMQLLNMFRLSTLAQSSGTIVRTLGCFIGYEYHLSMPYFLAVWSVTQLTVFLCFTSAGIYLVRHKLRTKFPWKELFFPSLHIKGIWGFTLGTSISGIIYACFTQASTLMVGTSLGAADAAIFNVANQVTTSMARPATLVVPSLYPEFVKLRDNKDWHTFRRTLLNIMCIISIIVIVLLLVSALFGNRILAFMLHHPCLNSTTVINLLTVNAILDIAITPLEPILTVLGNISYILRAKGLALALYVPTFLGLTHLLGINGSATAMIFTTAIIFTLCSYKTVRIITALRY